MRSWTVISWTLFVYVAYLSFTLTYGCGSGWFGSKCQYRCHCSGKRCTADGLCKSDSTCSKGWFGPACQYVDIASDTTVVNRSKALEIVTDGKDNTCVDQTTNEITVEFAVPFQFTWLRVHVYEYTSPSKFDIQLKNGSLSIPCTNHKAAAVSNTALDIHCDLATTITTVSLSGYGVGSLCTLYISGGRNVAVKETTKHPSTRNCLLSLAPTAVNHYKSHKFRNESCSCTNEGKNTPKVEFIFKNPVTLNRLVLYTIVDVTPSNLHRLQPIIIRGFSLNKKELHRFTYTEQSAHDVYTLQLAKPWSNVSWINIEATIESYYKLKLLTSCALQLLGESICPGGMFGRDCEHKCNCADRSEQCIVSTGGCSSGCAHRYSGEGCQQTRCVAEWFGSYCQYKCRCTDNKCDVDDGHCVNGAKCQRGWFGPSCQYYDLATSETAVKGNAVLATITDGDENTCINQNIRELIVAWNISYQFTWMRVHVKDPKFLKQISVQFKNAKMSLPCARRREAIISDTAMDVYCDVYTTVDQVILTGQGVQYLCSVYISGGRNVALRETTSQSSIYNREPDSSVSSNAVDDNTNGDFSKGSCTHTRLLDLRPNLNLTFTSWMTVNRFVLYNRLDGSGIWQFRLKGFILRGFSQKDEELFSYKDIDTSPRPVYTVQLPTPVSGVTKINVEATTPEPTDSNVKILTLCELQVFGDTYCQYGTWSFGRECEKRCNCKDKNEQCLVSTGGCTSGCSADFTGEGCQEKGCGAEWFGSRCQYKCRCTNNDCDADDGHCIKGAKCQQGWFGSACQYSDLATSDTVVNEDRALTIVTDGDENTCLDQATKQITVTWNIPYQFTWLRVRVKDPNFLNDVSVQFTNASNSETSLCRNRREARISATAMDVYCDLSVTVTQVIITGQGVQSLCSLHISGGRNVALKQNTHQSSNYSDYNQSKPSNVVDGSTSGRFSDNSCSHTDNNDHRPQLNITFSGEVAVNRYIVYNRAGHRNVIRRLQGFVLTSFNRNGQKTFQYNEATKSPAMKYTITTVTRSNTVMLTSIQATMIDSKGNTYLVMCEVEVYGDSVCGPGLFGRECENKCHCAVKTENCFVSTGGCPSGCAPGYSGEACQK